MARKKHDASAPQSKEAPPLYFTPPPPKKKRGGVKVVPDFFVRPAAEIPDVLPDLERPTVDIFGRSEAEILNAIEYAQRTLRIGESYKHTSTSAIEALESRRRNIETDQFWLRVVRGEERDPLGVEALGEWAPFRNQQQLEGWRANLARLSWWREQRERGVFVDQQTPRETPTVQADYWSETQGKIVDDLD